MSDNAEEAIARAEAAAARERGVGLEQRQAQGDAWFADRILIFLLALGFIGLLVTWATAKSALLLYGSLVGVIALTALWGAARMRRIHLDRLAREHEARRWESENPGGDAGQRP